MQVRPHAFQEKPGKHAALETRIWKENEKVWPLALKGPHGRTRGRLPAAYRHYICAPVEVKTPKASKIVLKRYSEYDS